jgi:oligoribonuclease
MTVSDSGKLVWMDIETTGLDASLHTILEVAVIVTTADLEPVAEPLVLVHLASPDDIGRMDPVARSMHEASGLLAEVANRFVGTWYYSERGVSYYGESFKIMDIGRWALGAYLREHTEPQICPLAGSSVHFDRSFLVQHMSSVNAHMHYRNFDVSAIHEAAKRWIPDVAEEAPEKRGLHRALPDLEDSLNIARYYRDAIQAGQKARRELSRMECAFRESLL